MNVNVHQNDEESQQEKEYTEEYEEETTDTGSMMPQHIRRRSDESSVDTEIELESRFITPQAHAQFPEITRDIRTSNFSDYDVDMSMRVGEILRYLDTIETSYFNPGDFDKSRSHFVSDLQYMGNTRAAYKGFMSQLLRTQRIENIPSNEVKETYEHGATNDIAGMFNKIRRGRGKSEKII